MTEPLDLSGLYTGGDYRYKLEGDGFTIENGKKIIDCSHMVYLLMKGAGYNITYENTSAMANSTYYEQITDLATVKRGDVALWLNATGHTPAPPLNHTGIIATFDGVKNGTFFGAQSSGVATANFGDRPHSGFWPRVTKVLRIKEQYRTGAQPAPVATPAPAPVGPEPLMNFQYPFRKADGKQFNNVEDVYKVLENEKSGHYLLGSNKFWHGGIHISDKSAPQCVLNEPVRCIADGEVVAYRLNKDYLESTFGDGDTAKKLKYSNSFCLVRHEYKSAPNPEEGPNKGKQNKLNFFSLYMHLLPYDRYPLAPEETPKPVVTMNFGDYKAYDKAPWIQGAVSYGLIKKGTRLEILDQAVDGVKTYAKGKILSGSVKNGSHKTRNVGDEVWFAYKENDAPYLNSQHKAIWTADKVRERLRPNYWQGKVKATAANKLDLYEAPTAPQNGQPVGVRSGNKQLIPTSVVEFDSKEVLNLIVEGKLRRMAQCTMVSGGLAAAGAVPESFWTCIENSSDYHMVDWASLLPSSFDSVESASTGIKAGDPIGYLGAIENLTGEDGGVAIKYQVHVEIFTAEADVKDFLKNVAGLKIGKQYLHLSAGTELKKKAPATGTAPLKKEHAVDLSNAPVLKEGAEDWYEVSIVEEDVTITGLVRKTGAEIITQHDWEKLGFQVVEEGNATADGFLDPDDTPQFFKDLFAKIDKNHDGDVSPNELTDALKNVDTRDLWTKLIAHHPTEWKDKAEAPKWSRLDQLLETSPKTLKHEKERISKYIFWDELSGRASVSSDMVWHFHPIGFVANFLTSVCIPVEKAKEIALLVSSGYEGKDRLDYEALAGNFDGQGMSFGIIQWNFGQGTLGPVLLAMRSADQVKFDACFDANMNFQSLLNSLNSASTISQMSWAAGVIANNNAGWKSSFKKLGEVEAFQKIQLDFAAKYNENIKSCVALMRELAPQLMVKVALRTYCALFDLCVQQNHLAKAEELIRTEFPTANITTQKELLVFVCRKRAEKAATVYRSDAFSRRMGIIEGHAYTATMEGITKTRANTNYGAIIEGDVCEI